MQLIPSLTCSHHGLGLHHAPWWFSRATCLALLQPVDLCVADDAQIGVSEAGFAQHQLFELDSRMTYMERVTGDLTSACYPTITISARVYRKPGFVIYNVIIPMAAFVIMAFMQFTITDRTNQDARLAVTLTLVLTAAAYKFSISSMVPSISYAYFAHPCMQSFTHVALLIMLTDLSDAHPQVPHACRQVRVVLLLYHLFARARRRPRGSGRHGF